MNELYLYADSVHFWYGSILEFKRHKWGLITTNTWLDMGKQTFIQRDTKQSRQMFSTMSRVCSKTLDRQLSWEKFMGNIFLMDQIEWRVKDLVAGMYSFCFLFVILPLFRYPGSHLLDRLGGWSDIQRQPADGTRCRKGGGAPQQPPRPGGVPWTEAAQR